MTVVVCFNLNIAGAVMVADSRLSYRNPQGQIHTVRDVCQKVFPPTAWSLLGIAGDLCLSNALAEATFNRLKATEWAEDLWLDHDDEVRTFVAAVVSAHTAVQPGHEGCVRDGGALLVSWIGLVNFNRADGTLDHQEPGTKAMAITSAGDIERQQRLADPLVIGDGGVIKPSLTIERALQVAWADVTRRFGTYVAMRFKEGRWVQEHRPTGTSVIVRRPHELLDEHGSWPIGKHEMFDPRYFLTNRSPGVYRTPPIHLLYAIYDPADVPPAVRASWGDQPLEPLSFQT